MHVDRPKAINGIADVVDIIYGSLQAILKSGFFMTTMRPITGPLLSLEIHAQNYIEPHPIYLLDSAPAEYQVLLR